MIKRAVLICLGSTFTVLGLIGLLVPIMPGFLFLAAAAVCFSVTSRRLQGRLERHPAFRGLRNRWRAGRHLPLFHRARLAFWLTAEATMNAFEVRAGR
jgi:uncharacterized membrane protein YbaN (DUF454 family)